MRALAKAAQRRVTARGATFQYPDRPAGAMIPFNLRQRVLLILSGFVAITAFLGLMLVWYTFRMEGLLASMTREDLAAAQRVESLETALLRQKGLVAYHLLDGSP